LTSALDGVSKKTKDSDMKFTSLLDLRGKKGILEELKVDPYVYKLIQYKQKWLNCVSKM